MRATIPGGLTGKARKTHQKVRTSRFRTQELIDDFLEPDAEPAYFRVRRVIPIRRRSEFQPSVEAQDGQRNTCVDRQLQFFSMKDPQPMLKRGGLTPSNHPPRSGKSRSKPDHRKLKKLVAGCVSRASTPRIKGRQQTSIVRFRGFLYGCAMGGAAAAVILLVLQATLL